MTRENHVPLAEALKSVPVFVDGDWIESKDQDPNGEVRLIQLADIGVGRFIDKSRRYLTTDTAYRLGCTFLERGDVLIARTPDPVGRACVFPGVGQLAVTAVDVCIVRVDPAVIDSNYLAHFLNSSNALRQVASKASGSTRQRISRSNLGTIIIPLPPLEEQRRIAAILDKAHRITLLQKDAKNAIELLPKSLFLSLFGDPRINPYSWPQYSLGELGRVVTGSTPPSSEHGMFEGTHPFVTPGDLGSGQACKRRLTEAGARRSRSVRKGSALVCCIGATIGKMDIAREDSAFNQQINAVEWGDSVIGEFGIEALRFFKDTISTAGASTTLPILKKSAFEKLRIPVPPIGLQRDYCRHPEAMSPCLARLQTAAQLGASLKQALMSKAFSGELLR
jgi:type I restriction enzyme S subunit